MGEGGVLGRLGMLCLDSVVQENTKAWSRYWVAGFE
jgi:hypothetical protein